MTYLHYELDLSPDELVQVRLDNRANVRLLEESNFQKYSSGQQYHYYGGPAEESPFRLAAPSKGRWHLVIDLGGHAGAVHAAVETISAGQSVARP